MFKTFRLATCASLLTLSPVLMAQASAAELKVVASFSIIADFAKNVGGDRSRLPRSLGRMAMRMSMSRALPMPSPSARQMSFW